MAATIEWLSMEIGMPPSTMRSVIYRNSEFKFMDFVRICEIIGVDVTEAIKELRK